MFDALLPLFAAERFLEPDEARRRLEAACARHSNAARCIRVGTSEEGRPIDGYHLGKGDVTVSLISGNHSDEPVGPDFLRRFVLAVLERRDAMRALLATYRFCIIPHTNPDGEYVNRTWRAQWPDFEAYLKYVVREDPGRDVEFGFPAMRRENAAVAAWLSGEGPFQVHGSLHGRAIAEGALMLIDRRWGYRTALVQERFRAVVQEEGLPFHDQNRQGEKGFFYLGPGVWTTPTGVDMRAFFRAIDDPTTAERFHDSSMEFVRRLGGDPLCYVTELPLFLVDKRDDTSPNVAEAYLAFKDLLPALRLRVAKGEPCDAQLEHFGLRPLRLETALRIHLRTLSAVLDEISPKADRA